MGPPLPSLTLYQPALLRAYAERLICGFTGKPLTLGGLNFPREEVLENRKQACIALGLNADKLIVPDQTHSANIRRHTDEAFPETDAVILSEPGMPVMVVVADCVPVILYDPLHHAGALVHAGWRGTAQAITAKTVERMKNELASKPESLLAVIGPCAGVCCYEVSDEVADAAAATVSHDRTGFIRMNASGKPQLDLKTVNRLQLEAAGVGQVEVLPDCTICNPESFWSYRRGEHGRQVAFMQLL